MFESISYNQQTQSSYYAHQSYSIEASLITGQHENNGPEAFFDKVSIEGESEVALTYDSQMALSGDGAAKFSMLQNLVANLLQEQGIDTKVMTGDMEIDIATLSPEEAQSLVAEDGYYGVEQTAERIFQFGVGVAGGDPSRLDAIKQGVEQGFQEAKEVFGGWLPDISYDTYDAVMEKLDSWAAEARQ
jgi:hypothetical protein